MINLHKHLPAIKLIVQQKVYNKLFNTAELSFTHPYQAEGAKDETNACKK